MLYRVFSLPAHTTLFNPIQWLVSLGFSLVFSALFSKLWRINRVFAAAASLKRVVVTEKDVLKPFAILMTLNFVILLSWTLVDPMVFERVYTDELTSYGRCMPQGSAWKGFIATLAILNFIALIIVNVQAYHARSINDELSESKYIGLVTLSMFQIFIVGVPLLVIVYNDPSGKETVAFVCPHFISVKTHFFSSRCSILLCVVWNHFHHLHDDPFAYFCSKNS